MDTFWFYLKLGLEHVLDYTAYDHVLFLAALTVPFIIKDWKKVLLLASVFTITHCLSLALSAYGVVVMDPSIIEFLIPVTILLTALFNINYIKSETAEKTVLLHVIATSFFGLIHGFGFSTYFKMLVSQEESKLNPLFGFAMGIEISQLIVVSVVLALGYLFLSILKVPRTLYVIIVSIIIALITIPMLIETFPF